jgi:cell division protein FtsI (penicillin-binding protein 3)
MLRRVVYDGLGGRAGSKQFSVAGKTGTAQISQGAAGYKNGARNYLVSFCGFFPADNPKYSCIVSIQKPGLPASGGTMAGSVFGKIAERVYAKDLRLPLTAAVDSNSVVIPDVKAGEVNDTRTVLKELGIANQSAYGFRGDKESWCDTHQTTQGVTLENRDILQDFVPSVIGMGAKDAVYLLESKGLRVAISGVGKVKRQSIPGGTKVRRGETVRIYLN